MAIFAAMMTFAGGRWSPTRKSKGHVFTAVSNMLAPLTTYGAGNNDPHSSVFAYETGSPTPQDEAAAIWCGSMAGSLRGQLPNQPVQTLPLQGFLAPNTSGPTGTEAAWTRTGWQTLLGTGLGVARYDQAGNASIVRAPTTYQTNAYGQPDQSYFDTETMYLLAAIGDYLNSWFTQKYPRALVADDGTPFGAGLPIVTPKAMMGDLISAYNQMQTMGWVEDASAFIAATSVTRNLTNPSELDILFAPYLVAGLRDIATTIQFRQFSAAAAAAASNTLQPVA
jgi:phage tail sheath gpL-like